VRSVRGWLLSESPSVSSQADSYSFRADESYSITWSHWDPAALEDIQKTFRFYYQCDDIWVCQGGGWSLKYSVVKNMGPGVEAPYKAQLLKSN
jgi:hypothetical protein